MFDTNIETQDRGQVGIGTLIVFIALVLVAAIAAGVLINTAGFLQSQAEATGEESTEQVSNNLDITSAIGEDTGSGLIDTVTLTVKQQPGSDAIDLDNAEIQILAPAGSATLGSSGDLSAAGAVEITPVTAESTGNNLLEAQSDRYEIEIDLTANTDRSLSGCQDAELTITTDSGGQAFKTLQVSSPIDSPEKL